jgi:hypothetical protein
MAVRPEEAIARYHAQGDVYTAVTAFCTHRDRLPAIGAYLELRMALPVQTAAAKVHRITGWFEWIYFSLLRVEDRPFRYTFQQNQLMSHPISQLLQRIHLNIFALRTKTDYIRFRGMKHGIRTFDMRRVLAVVVTCWFLAWSLRCGGNVSPKCTLNHFRSSEFWNL